MTQLSIRTRKTGFKLSVFIVMLNYNLIHSSRRSLLTWYLVAQLVHSIVLALICYF